MPKFYDRSVLRQALFALAFDVGGIISGRIILVFAPLFGSELWILALFPPVLSVRGNIGGIYSGKLSTMLHIGEAEPRLRNNSTEFYSLIRAIFTLTYVDTLGIGILAYVVNIIVGNAGPTHFPLFVAVPVLTCLTAMVVAVPIVSFLGTEAFKRGLDPDIVLYPMMSTIDDIILTISYVLVVRVALLPGFLVNMATVVVVLGGIFLIIFVKHRGENVFLRTLTEGGPAIILSSLLGTIGGIGLSSLREEIENRPSVLMLYPALIDALGDIGSILGSMETTKLALGFASSFRTTLKEALADLASVEMAAAIMHVFFGLAAFLLGHATGLTPNAFVLIALALSTNLMSFPLISLLSLGTATQTFKRGYDPDNFVIPLVTSASDFLATLALMIVLTVIG